MYRNKLLLRSVMLCGILICAVSAQEKILQNGMNGYAGCKDTWILQGAKEGLVMNTYMPERFDVYNDTCLS